MFNKLILLSALVLAASCDKEEMEAPPSPPLSTMDLLTQKKWVLSGYGLDFNNNGVIDPGEQTIQDCEKDNLYTFEADGSGLVQENQLSCANGITEFPFTWKFTDHETAIDFTFGIARILRLTEHELVTYPDATGAGVKHLTLFRH